MTRKQFIIILIMNIVLLSFLTWLFRPKVIIQQIVKPVNVSPDDKSAFGNAILESDGTYIQKSWNGTVLKKQCPNGVKYIDLLNDDKLFICR